jgi:nitroimidazol reductase NimA-like FMN-containing flavoprotein (pyridoxamine 5'-phosphate oxidase superfamily)
MVELARDERLQLVESAHPGRLAITRQALPLVLPVAHGMLDGAPVVHVGSVAVHDDAENEAVCCFEVDDAAHDWTSAWSVIMIGRIHLINDPRTVECVAELSLPRWLTPNGKGSLRRTWTPLVRPRGSLALMTALPFVGPWQSKWSTGVRRR